MNTAADVAEVTVPAITLGSYFGRTVTIGEVTGIVLSASHAADTETVWLIVDDVQRACVVRDWSPVELHPDLTLVH